MNWDRDTPEQCNLFDEYVKSTGDGRQQSRNGTYGYNEEEWEAFQYGWNAAKKHFGIE